MKCHPVVSNLQGMAKYWFEYTGTWVMITYSHYKNKTLNENWIKNNINKQ